jgi:saccharopine dehydrogenase-like NADP-dependent oxidoreductase
MQRENPMKVAVLGAGRVGRAMAIDLAKDPEIEVTVVDHSQEALDALSLKPGLGVRQADLSNPAVVREVLKSEDMAVGAVPGFMGFKTLQAILEAGKPVVDIAFFGEDPFLLDGLAKTQGLVAIVDAGVAPGCSNMILGRLEEEMDETHRFECVVGGLPVARPWPFQYKAPFSPVDVLEEYTRPARLRRAGTTVTLPALSEVEVEEFPGVGALEAFNTDGLRTLLKTCGTPDMVEKTMRYPGHADWMRGLRTAGFFDTMPMTLGDVTVSPMDVTARLLEAAWAFEEKEEDITVMRVRVDGTEGGIPRRHVFSLLDRYDTETDTSSMARTTGYTCTAMVRMVAQGLYTEPGITPPEFIGRDPACFDFVMNELDERGVHFHHEIEELAG